MQKTVNLTPINYRGKEIAKGFLLGERRGLWELKRYKKPLWAKLGEDFVSEVSPQKKDILVYIPASVLIRAQKTKKPILISDTGEKRRIQVVQADKFSITFENAAIKTEIKIDKLKGTKEQYRERFDLNFPPIENEFNEGTGIESTWVNHE